MAAGAVSVCKIRSFAGRNPFISSLGHNKMAVSSLHATGVLCEYRSMPQLCYSLARPELGKVLKIGAFHAISFHLPMHSIQAFQFFGRQLHASPTIKMLEKRSSRITVQRGAKRKSSSSPDSERLSAGKLSRRSISVCSLKRKGVSYFEQKQSAALKPTKSSSSHTDAKQIQKKAMRNQETRKESPNSKDSIKELNADKQKKGKRLICLDPKDKTSKRCLEGYPLPGEEVLQEGSLENAGPSKNALFRAIQPAPKLLYHIEKHMLGRRRLSEWQKAGYDVKLTPAPLDNVPYSKKNERQPIQEEAFRYKLRFAAAAKVSSSFPPVDLPEVAFAGRSNVGKSSLINALTRQWGVARTSDKPGLTQSINFFRLGGRLCLVDLPGYGFAYAKEEKKEAWQELVKEFVSTRAGLKRVCVLVDAKWGLKERDEELIALMESAGTKYQIVLTKTDTVFPQDLARRVTQIQEVFEENKSLVLPLMMVSSKSGEGLELLRANLAKLAKSSLI